MVENPETTTPERFDPKAYGLKCGLEIHQQVGRLGDHKLFCNCPATIVERQPDLVVERRLRASAGETGALDAAAAAEQAKGKKYLYHAFHEDTCLVELDEEPPHPVNQEVIKTAIMVAKACNSTILPHVQFMRKTIVDGSATSGFQRTGLFALGGTIPDVNPPVRLQTIAVEEDAAKIVTRTSEADTYNLSRLGIPLIEIATEPDIVSPQHMQETAAQLGMILRSTKRVKRGLGTIRQDLNISIAGGTRIEIKGAQDLRLIPTYVEYEAKRQKKLLALKDLLHGKDLGMLHHAPLVDATSIFSTSTVGFIKSALAKGDKALGIKVPHFGGLFRIELCPNYRVGSELADLARAQGFGGLIHSDEDMKKYGVMLEPLRSLFGLDEHDGFILLIGNPGRIKPLITNQLIPRIEQFAAGVPKEVRKANPDGTTSFLRTMPGSARMYPETDVPIVTVNAKDVAAPKLFTEQVKDLVKATGISEDQAREVVREGVPFDEYLARYPSIEPVFIATATLTYGKEILARYKKELDHIALLEPLFEAVERKEISKEAVFEILVEIAEGKARIDKIDYAKYARLSTEDLQQIVREALRENPAGSNNALMGKVMAKARGKAEGKQIIALIEQERRAQL